MERPNLLEASRRVSWLIRECLIGPTPLCDDESRLEAVMSAVDELRKAVDAEAALSKSR